MTSKPLPSHNGPPPNKPSLPPSPTLYVKDLPGKITKQDVRMALYMLFSTYGPVLDVVVMRTAKMRGQSHVVFRDVQASTQAMRALQGFDFFGKELEIQYAKGRSDVFTKLEGVYKPPNAPVEAPAENSLFTAPAVTGPGSGAAQNHAKLSENAASNAEPQGIKRRREDESDQEQKPMEEDDDDDVSMEASSDED